MFNIQDELRKLPDKPGVYIMKDKDGKIIYVGKAINLRNRIKQYFNSYSGSGHALKVQAMVSRIKEFEYIITDTELEALILECNLIKKHRPRFNVLLKDDKNYPYIKVTMNEEYPRIFMTRRVETDGSIYFGPYSSVPAVKETLNVIKKLFPVKTCRRVLPRDIGKDRPCLNYHIRQCLGPCQGTVDKEEYMAVMKDICGFLGGKYEEIVKNLEQKMRTAADRMDFEEAAVLRNKINSIKLVMEKQKVLSTQKKDQDVVALAREQADACVQVFFVRGGKLIGRKHFIFEGVGDVKDEELISSFIKQFYDSAEYIPGEVILQYDIDEARLIETWLGQKKSAKVHISVPRKGEKRHLVEMVAVNANDALRQFRERLMTEGDMFKDGAEILAELLMLDKVPQRIEAFDISNTGSTEMVASMVVFEEGKPARSEYRRFKIKFVENQDDYACMQEVLYRRLKRAEAAPPDSFGRLPDIIMVDGGLTHVKAALDVLREFNVAIPVYGMAKDDRHRTKTLIGTDGEVDLSKNLTVLRFVAAIQGEAHRFALDYNKKLRQKRYKSSVLDDINGIGPKRKRALIKYFGSLSRIKAAGIEELLEVEGINRSIAEKIYKYFHS